MENSRGKQVLQQAIARTFLGSPVPPVPGAAVFHRLTKLPTRTRVRNRGCPRFTAGTDYVTEKLWDCLEAGAVPIYLGAPNILDHLPFGRRSAIFIDDFKDVDELAAHLKKVWTVWAAGCAA